MLVTELALFIIPLFITGLLHHFVIIHFGLLQWLAQPIDGGYHWRNAPVFGQAKTWRGVIVMTVLTGVVLWLLNGQVQVFPPYFALQLGSLLGFAYSLGELPNSFIKRRMGIAASQPTTGWLYWYDQLDSVIASTVVVAFLYSAKPWLLVSLLICGGLLHVLTDQALHRWSYKSSIKKK